MFPFEIELERDGSVSLTSQIYRVIRENIARGIIAEGEKLPSSRRLSATLDVSRNTVNTAYELLRAEGMIDVRTGAAPVVNGVQALGRGEGVPMAAPSRHLSKRGAVLATNHRFKSLYGERGSTMQPGEPSRTLFPSELWARCLRRAARRVSGGALGYEHLVGLPELQRVLARYLSQERGVRAKPHQILILPTVQSALMLMTQAFTDPGDQALIEEPGYLGARSAFLGAGLKLMPFQPNDSLDEGALDAARLIYVTPSHQYPLGTRMDMTRRLELLAFARKTGAIILEDDYDSEFLFEGRPLAALQGLGADGEVAYMGTVAKSMLPAIRLAYLVVPEVHVEALSVSQRALGALANVHVQAALADFIDDGHYRAHLKKIRVHYQRSGALLSQQIGARFGNKVSVSTPTGGLQMPLFFNEDVNDVVVASHMNAKGFGVVPLSIAYLGTPQAGLVIGFSEATPAMIDRFCDVLQEGLSVEADR
ncbi:PLP-dependent aminotransferase family protein [Pseudovibrio exalbescens]|uniref:MocR-like pyridoxine biosynthesis transcription factor PdxR n=1 Tax=Pseudovibrio exalbescens TaxID=197461 RepID=UPI0023671BE5|nr:PLP-dependent aminotransferase family protein [Pseudovibrio exalbescens]MDD7910310.1 PLP-dependent aminotransferase family protein [Pseudovibrio exalbescens]